MKLAALIHPHTAHDIDILYQRYMQLDQNERSLLSILSLVYKPVGVPKLSQIIGSLIEQGFLSGAKSDFIVTPSQRAIWIEQGLLLDNREGLQVSRGLANRLTDSLDELATEQPLTAQQKRLTILLAAEDVVPVLNPHSWQKKDIDRQRVIRDFLYMREEGRAEAVLELNKNPQVINYNANQILVEMWFLPFDITAFLKQPSALQYQAFATLFRFFQKQGKDCQYPIQLLEQVCAAHAGLTNPLDHANCRYLLAEQYLYQLRFSDFEGLLSNKDETAYALQLRATYHFLTGKNELALERFELAIKAKNKLTRRKNQYLNDVLGYFYKLALIVDAHSNKNDGLQTAMQQIDNEERDRKVNSDFFVLNRALEKTIRAISTGGQYSAPLGYSSVAEDSDYFCHHLGNLNHLLAHIWCNTRQQTDLVRLASQCNEKFEYLGYSLFATISQQIIASLTAKASNSSFSQDHADNHRLINFADLITPRPQWDLALDKLIALNPNASPAAVETPKPVNQNSRLIWVLTIGYEHRLTAREQKLNKTGWSKGRVVPLKKLKQQAHIFSYFSDSDIRICRAITKFQDKRYHGYSDYALEGLSALEAAVGVDNLYLADDLEQPIKLTKREPELLVHQQGDQLCLSIADLSATIFEHNHDVDQPVYDLKPLSSKHYQLTVFSPEHISVAEIIGEGGLLIPSSAKQKVLEGISAIAPLLNIQSNISELDTGLEFRECDSRLVINIQPTQHGLSFTCLVMPLGEKGPAFKPGLGNANLSAEIEGKRISTERDLIREEVCLDQLDQVCPAFIDMPDNLLVKDEFQAALSVLEQLEKVAKQSELDIVLRWPKGKKIKLSKPLDSASMQLGLSKNSEWFDITGNLQVDDEQVIELRKLLELISTSNGRFVAMGNEQILALSDDLRNRLEQINQVTDGGKFHPFASLQIEEATTGMRMKTLHAWDKQTHAMHRANEITPVVPETLQAELRDYQLAGFDWASRLAHWGAGACLADDMGLGKTLQALAVLLSRSDRGPSLVIAPTSVCFNWQQEALKFAPTLKMTLFADASGTQEREKLLSNLAALDCIVISYGLLQRESELLKQVQWATIIADEAQALKNPLAKRTKAAVALKGDFKMITTGTPIENDLVELWSLFRFINPGLLGNLKRFVSRFAQPIENAKEDRLAAHKARQGLKKLIQPFVLRRMKNQVLTELPSRTEININVEMSPKEQAFYEGLRLNAIDKINQDGAQSNIAEQRIRMLAELVKLRQACCNPKLILAETDIPSAKLAALDELLKELRLNNHKALIFSQFVGHLQLIKQHLDNNGFCYQYLDGSTPQKARQKRVNAFQSGDGDVFLISLKAGGSGLNLTAADYVIHMDPWWNPAVEDQASDRAHRMGQQRPVTIYRLVTQNTIEEKIVALHQHKRNLADQLLSGNETASKLSVDDMLVLLKQTF